MISEEVARDGLTALSVAAVMIIEDAADGLTTAATDPGAGQRLAAALTKLGTDLSALAAAASVFDRYRSDDAGSLPRG